MGTFEGNYQQKIIIKALILALIFSGIILLIFPNPKEYIYGLVFGTSINVLNFRLMGLTFEKAVNMPQNKVMAYVVANYFVRYVIYGAMLTISALADYINFYTAILGIFMVKIVILSSAFCDMIFSRLKKGNKVSK
ncbi:ATP synthase subunit I [Proteiniborus sp.]|uniref:ATP synthase subunit I n=1 Tax=Proteiniborus sp. TaxID=2079015 RepID=UPI00332C6234